MTKKQKRIVDAFNELAATDLSTEQIFHRVSTNLRCDDSDIAEALIASGEWKEEPAKKQATP